MLKLGLKTYQLKERFRWMPQLTASLTMSWMVMILMDTICSCKLQEEIVASTTLAHLLHQEVAKVLLTENKNKLCPNCLERQKKHTKS